MERTADTQTEDTYQDQEAQRSLDRIRLRMAQRRGFDTIEEWHRAERLARETNT